MGGKTSTSTGTVSVPAQVLAQYNSVNAQAQQTAATPFQTYSGEFVAPVNAEQNSGITATNAAANEAQPYYQAATGTLGSAQAATNPANTAAEYGTAAAAAPVSGADINQYLSPYLGDVLESTEALQNQSNQQQQAGQLGNAINSGAFGSDRTGIAAANLEEQQNLANNSTIANIANTGYQSALGTAQQEQNIGLAGAQQLANIGSTAYGEGANTANELGALGTGAQTAGLAGASAQLAAGTVQQQTQQAQDTALYNQFEQQQSYPFQVDQFLAGIAEGTGSLSGSTTTTTQPGGFFSDRRLKRDIKKIGETFDHQDVVSYKMGDDNRTHIGLIAQNVEKKHPEAVGLAAGYKTVDYEKATKDAANQGHFYAGGVVPFPRKKYATGGYPGDSGGLAGVLQAQQAMYSQMGGSGGVAGTSRVPTASGSAHMLAVASGGSGVRPPQTGVQNVQQLAGLAKTGEGLYKDFTTPAATTAPAATVMPTAGAPSGSGIDTSNGVMGSGVSPTGDAQNATDQPLTFSLDNDDGMKTGGVAGRRRFDVGGTPYAQDDGELDIPDDDDARAKLATAPTIPSQSQNGLGDAAGVMGIVGDVVGLMNRGGVVPFRRKRDAGGQTQDDNQLAVAAPLAQGPAAEQNSADMQDIADIAKIAGAVALLANRGGRIGYDSGGTPTADDDTTPDAIPAATSADTPSPAGGVVPANAQPASPSLWDKIKGVAESPGVLAALEGLGAMGTARTVHPGVALAAGLGAAAGAYPELKQGLAASQLTQAQAQEEQAQAGLKQFELSQAQHPTTPYALPSAPDRPEWMGSPSGVPGDPQELAFQQYAPLPAGRPAAVTQRQIQLSYVNPQAAQYTGEQYDQQLTNANNLRARNASGDYLSYAAAANAAPGQVLAQLGKIKNTDAANELAVIQRAGATPDQQETIGRNWAAQMALQAHQWSARPTTVNNGVMIDAQTNTPVAGSGQLMTGLTPEQKQAALAYWAAPIVVGNSLPTPRYKMSGFNNLDQAVISSDSASRLRSAPPAVLGSGSGSGATPTTPIGQATTPPAAAAAGSAPANPQPPKSGARASVQAPANASIQAGANGNDAYMQRALASAKSGLEYRENEGPPVVDQNTKQLSLNQQTINQANRQSLLSDAAKITDEQSAVKQYLLAAKEIMNSRGAPETGFPGSIEATITSKFNGVDAGNYQEVSKYLMNAAVQQAHTNFPGATQSEFAQQVGEMSPNVHMPPQTIDHLVTVGLRTANWMTQSANRASVWANTPGVNPVAFTLWNQRFYPRDKLVNLDPGPSIYENPKTGLRSYKIGGQWTY